VTRAVLAGLAVAALDLLLVDDLRGRARDPGLAGPVLGVLGRAPCPPCS
jgi:hypothetical protein